MIWATARFLSAPLYAAVLRTINTEPRTLILLQDRDGSVLNRMTFHPAIFSKVTYLLLSIKGPLTCTGNAQASAEQRRDIL